MHDKATEPFTMLSEHLISRKKVGCGLSYVVFALKTTRFGVILRMEDIYRQSCPEQLWWLSMVASRAFLASAEIIPLKVSGRYKSLRAIFMMP